MGTALYFFKISLPPFDHRRTMPIVLAACELLTVLTVVSTERRIVRGQSSFGRPAFSKTFEKSTIRQRKLSKAAYAWPLSAKTKI